VGNFLFLPLAIIIGRRPIFILAAVMLAFASVGAALTKTFTAHLTARIFQGFAAGATESLLPLIITDMTFVC
jgi:MFS family permease